MRVEMIDAVVAALRDIAEKVLEQSTHTGQQRGLYGNMEEITFSSEKYSKEWIAGRLTGMADILEQFYVKRDAAP